MFGTLNKVQEIVNQLAQENSNSRRNGQKIANQLLGRTVYQDNTIGVANVQGEQDTMRAPIDAANHLYNINYGHEIKSNRPVIGKIIVFVKRVIRKILSYLLTPIIEEQNRFNASVTQSLNEIHKNVISLISQENENRANIESLDFQIDICKENLEVIKNRISIVEDNQMLLGVRINKIKANNNEKKEISLASRKTMENPSTTYNEIDYFSFENAFRGSQDEIKNAQAIYVEYFKGKDNILDMGCGRGEFLELLKDNGINAIGVDLYDEFVELCKEKGLSAVCGDAIEYLNSKESESLGGIFAAQLVEHLKPEQIVDICNLAYDKLQVGGCIILETPNPKCLSIYTNAFYIDPSHVKPVHPETMRYFLKQAGFKEIQILYTDNSKIPYKLPLLDCENANNLEEFNSGINLLSDLIFGSQDYAIIAKK